MQLRKPICNVVLRRCTMLGRLEAERRSRRTRRGAAVVELAVLLPLLVLAFVLAVDFGRVYYTSLTLQNCAWAGALYASDPFVADESPYSSVQEAALADAANLSPQPTITQKSGTDPSGRSYVDVTAAYSFKMLTFVLGSDRNFEVARSVRMYIAAIEPEA